MSNIHSRLRQISLLGAAALTLAGCATPCCDAVAPTPLVSSSRKIIVLGHGGLGNYGQYGSGQQKLMATRAAQVDAYRNLAERVHGFEVSGTTAVSAFATQSDTVRAYVEAFIRGARLMGVTSNADGIYEATVELDLTPQFMACVQVPSSCSAPAPVAKTCASGACGQSSMAYVGQ